MPMHTIWPTPTAVVSVGTSHTATPRAEQVSTNRLAGILLMWRLAALAPSRLKKTAQHVING